MNSKALFPSVILVVFLGISLSETQEAFLSVGDGLGTPNSSGNVVQINLDNTEVGEVGGIQFDLSFDSNALSFVDILPTERTDSVDCLLYVFEWNLISDCTVRILILRVDPALGVGTAPIATLLFDVHTGAASGEYPILLSNVKLARPGGDAGGISTITQDGIFTVVAGAALQIRGTSGAPGSEGNTVFLNLSNEMALSEVSLTLNFDPTVFSLTDVLPTDRTHDQVHFDWNAIDPGNVGLSIQSDGGNYIPNGSGAIACFFFTISTEVDFGVYPLQLSEVTVLDSAHAPVGVTLIDGDFEVGISDIALSAYEHDFGEVCLGDTTSWWITITNIGNASLTIFNVISNDSDFVITSPLFPRTIRSWCQLGMSIAFAPTSPGQQEGTLTVTSNDPDEDTVFVRLTGTGKDPRIEFSVT